MTSLILAFFLYAIGFSIVAGYLRLSSKIIIRKPLNWKLCFKLVGVLCLLSILSRAVQTIVLPDYSSAIMFALGIIVHIIVQLLVSASFLHRYGKLPDGGEIGWKTGFKIAGLTTLFALITVIIFRIWIMIMEMILQP